MKLYPDSLKTREKLDAFREPEDSDAAVSKRKSSTELGKTSANQSVTNSTSLDEGFSGCEVNGVYLPNCRFAICTNAGIERDAAYGAAHQKCHYPCRYLFVLTHESTHRPSPSAAEARFLLLAFALGRM